MVMSSRPVEAMAAPPGAAPSVRSRRTQFKVRVLRSEKRGARGRALLVGNASEWWLFDRFNCRVERGDWIAVTVERCAEPGPDEAAPTIKFMPVKW